MISSSFCKRVDKNSRKIPTLAERETPPELGYGRGRTGLQPGEPHIHPRPSGALTISTLLLGVG